jgi:hypothetical protein
VQEIPRRLCKKVVVTDETTQTSYTVADPTAR